jgi:ankyrin repeat protein
MNNSIGFKATNKDFKCKDIQFSLNKKYIHQGKISLCNSGFHFCKKLTDVLEYYTLEDRFFIIRYNSENYSTDGNKSVTDEIEFLEEITEENLFNIMGKYNCDNDDFLLFSIRKNYSLELVKFLVEKGANVQADDNYTLIYAFYNGNLEVIKFLVEKGANIQADDNYALRYASYNGNLEVVKYLVEKGADVQAKNNCALIWASRNKHLEVVNFLVEKGAIY